MSSTESYKGLVEIFDPPMCCSTGICGPNVDQSLIDVNETITALKTQGYVVERYQLNMQPKAFGNNPDVLKLLGERQIEALPITVVNGRVVKVGEYPSTKEVQQALGL